MGLIGWLLRAALTASMFFCWATVRAQAPNDAPTSWQSIRKKGRGEITVYWFESKPFIYRNAKEQLEGVEYDLMEGFRKYLKDRYDVDLKMNWKEANDFYNTYLTVRQNTQHSFGVSAFSITSQREAEVQFAPPYMADISVLISSQNVHSTQSVSHFNEVFNGLTAITIKGTTYEQDLLRLKEEAGVDFNIQYIPSYENILLTIESMDNAFGFIDLPVYMMLFRADPSMKVKRQNHYPVKRRGYSVIYPLQSDWKVPVDEYFSMVRNNFEPIISKYLDVELYRFVEALARESDDELELLNKEKEIQYQDLLSKSVQLAQQTRTSRYLVAITGIVGTFLLIIVVMYRKRNEQKEKIEIQRQSIALKNEQLEKRNEHLVALDEEKNNLIKILAHDLRTPINHVQGLAQVFLLSNPQLPEDQKQIIQNITDASLRLNKMISNILDIDAAENKRIKILEENVDIRALLQKVIRSFDKQAQKKEMELVLQPHDGSPVIFGDPLFLIQVFENLISNALKFSPKHKQVSVVIREEGSEVRISVIDQGPGLSEEDQQLLFKKFQRLSTHPTDGEKSTGLGLSIVKQYVELMGGRVWCESEPGKGAAFHVAFTRVGC
ncbi:MAG: ATP-binding protein [Bacteroidota bacterium]